MLSLERNFEIKGDFLKYLKESHRGSADQHFPVESVSQRSHCMIDIITKLVMTYLGATGTDWLNDYHIPPNKRTDPC